MKKNVFSRKLVCFFISFCFLFNSSGFAQILPSVANRQILIQTPVLKYLSINQANPNNYFNFLLDKGSANLNSIQLDSEAKKLVNYFFLGITIPDNAFWVNLRPDEPGRITSEFLAKTDLGKDLLEQDLLLKKTMSGYLHPHNPKGKEFWSKLYAKIGKDKVNKAEITTSNRVWIVPDEAIVVETESGAFVAKARLKVLLENEYLKHSPKDSSQAVSESLMKEIIIPLITKEVNESQEFSRLRQIYNSLILSQWFKRKYKTSEDIFSPVINKGDTNGLESQIPWSKQEIWQEYLRSYNNGEYKIKDSLYGLSRMYFSGGVLFTFGQNDSGSGSGGSSPIKIISPGEFFKDYPQIAYAIDHGNEIFVGSNTVSGKGVSGVGLNVASGPANASSPIKKGNISKAVITTALIATMVSGIFSPAVAQTKINPSNISAQSGQVQKSVLVTKEALFDRANNAFNNAFVKKGSKILLNRQAYADYYKSENDRGLEDEFLHFQISTDLSVAVMKFLEGINPGIKYISNGSEFGFISSQLKDGKWKGDLSGLFNKISEEANSLLGRYQKAQTTQGAQFLHNKFPGITILDAEDSLKSDIDKGLSAIEKALDKIPNEHRALIKTINIHSAADGNILAFTNEGTIIFNGWTKEKIDLNNDTVETLASAKRTEQMFWHETGHLVFANLSEDQKQEYKKLALASGVEDRMKLDKELFAEDYRNITATAEAAKEFNHMWRKSYRNGDKPIDVRGNKAEREAFFKKYVMPGSASTSSPITGQSGMENPGFINPERLWSKDNNFLGAVDYFNTTVISQDKISWENAVNLFSKLMGEDVNAESVRQLNAMREKSAAGRGKNLKRQDLSTLIAHKINAASRIIPGFTGGVLELANSRINSEGLKQKDIDNNVRDIATWIYTEIVSSPQFFYGLRGFGDAGGHNRVAWFIMNYFLIKNGYAPFYFKDARQYNTTVQANTWAIRDMVGASSPIKRNNSDTEIPFKRIFYVDDRFNFRAAVSDYIQQQFPGAKVFSAGGFAQAKLILETQAPFDLIITDLTMGDDPSNLNVEEKEGGKLVTYIRSKGSSRVPIMILSASVKGNEAKLKRMGADYFVDKNAASGFLEGLRFGIVNMAKKSSSPINGEIPLHQAKILTLEVSSELQELRIFYHDVDKIINVLAYVKRAIKLINKYGFNNDHKIDNIITKVDNLVNDIEKTKKPQKEKYSNNIRALLNVIETSEIMVESDKKEFEDNLNALRNFVPEYTAPLGEINTAIDILDGFMFGLPESPQKEQVRSFLKNSKQDVENVKRHIAEFSNEGVLEDGNIAAFLNDYVNVAKRHNPGVEISYKGPESRNMRVNFNEYSLRRVLDNMVNNAIVHGFGGVEELKNITPGESKIEVVLEAVDGQAQVVIRDNGQGVKSGTEQKIFDYEFTTGGTGIGLSSVKDVIKKHNGAVVLAESQEGWGATFKITLPLASSPIENKAAADSIRNNETRVKDIFDKLVSEKKLGGVQLPKQFKRAYALILSYGLLGEGDVKSLLENRLSAERYQGIEPYVGRESVSKEIDKAQSQLKGIYSQYAPGRQPGGHIVFFDRQGHEAEYDPVTDTIYLRADDYFGIAPFLSHEDTHRDQMLAPEFITEGVADYVAKEVADKLGQPFRVNHQASVEFVTGLANELGKPAILKAQYSSLETLAPVVGKEAVEYLELLAVIEHLIPAIGRNVLKNTRMFTSGGMTALWNNKDNEMLIKGLNNYIIGELKVALGNIEELKRSKDFASTISRINDYVMGEFDNASVARDSGQISLDRLIFKERWTDSDKTKFSEAILKACKAACGLISREEQKNYPNYAGPVYDALAFLSVSLPQELNDMLKETFGLESDRVLIFYGLKERKVVDIDDNAGTVTLFNIPVAKISLSENDTLKVTFLLKDSDIEIIRNKLLERIDNTAYFKKVIEDKISSSPVERKNIQSPLIETLKGKGFNAEDFQNYISELINNELIDGVIVWGNITSADFNQTKPRVGLYLLLKADRDYSEKPRYSGVDVIALNGIEEGIKTAINGGGRFDYNIMHDAESSFDNSTTQFFNQNSLVLLSNDFVSDKDGRSKRLNELNQKLNSRKINPVFLENVYSLSPEGWNRIGIIGEASENQAPAGVSLNNTDASPLPIKENDRMIFPGQDVNAILKEAVTSLPASIFNPNSIKLGLGNVPVVTGILQDSQKYDQELTAFQIKGDGWAKTLSSVFSHLAHNSGRAKASEMVITTGLSADGNNILIEVKDNGQGIDKSLLDNGNIESIFEKDRSFRESPRPDQAGLGLYYSRIMVTNQMGGTIEVVRNVSLNDAQGTGKEPGVTFRISLPVNLPSVDINKKQEIADKGGIDLSNIKITLKNEEFVLGLNAADLKILRAAKALNENWDSLAVLYMHELMLLLKQNIASDITQRPALLNILSRLDSHKSLDEEVTVFYHTMLS